LAFGSKATPGYWNPQRFFLDWLRFSFNWNNIWWNIRRGRWEGFL
jgi:hypothetical protein